MRAGFWPKCRIFIRWCRISILLLILAAACLLLWLNQVGLPATLKKPLLTRLQERGLHLQFSRMRLRMTRGIVIENVRVAATDNPDSPTLSVNEVQLLLDFSRLLHGHLEIQGVVLREGLVIVPVNSSGTAPSNLELTHIQTDLRFQNHDTWSLDNFQADFLGTKLALTGDIAHARDFRNWDIFHRHQPHQPGAWQPRLQNISQILREIHLQSPSWVTLNVEGDARNPQSFVVRLQLTAPAAQTPWFNGTNIQLNANLTLAPHFPTNAALPDVWGELQPYRLAWSARLGQLQTADIHAAGASANGSWRAPHLAFYAHLQDAARTNTPLAFSAHIAQFNANITASAAARTNVALSGFPGSLPPCEVVWSTRLNALTVQKVKAEVVAANGGWQAPDLTVKHLAVYLGGGWLEAGLKFNVNNHQLTFTNSSAFDLRTLAPALPARLNQQLAAFSSTEPPVLHLGGSVDVSPWLHLPSASNGPPMALQGDLLLTNALLSGLVLDQLQTRFVYSNDVWRVPQFTVVREKTRLELDATADPTSHLFTAHMQGTFDVNQLRPWIKGKMAVREVNRLTFHEPLALNVLIRGRLDNPATLAVSGQLDLTNFAARGGPVDTLATGINYSNKVILFDHPVAWRKNGTQTIMADAIAINLSELRIYFTNGFSTADPQAIADSIGPKTGRVLEPFQFLAAPTARVNGYVSLHSSEDNEEMEAEDLQVDVLKGTPFRWRKFESRNIVGTVHWFGGTLLLTNLNAEFYGGNAVGKALFDFRPRFGNDFNFAVDITDGNLHALIAGLGSPTNHLEGLVSGHLVVTSGNTTNWQAMNGYGHATLRDGLIWDAPIFGILSPALNAIVPGLGSSRATEAAAQFTMNNGVIFSDTTEIHTALMQLKYVGTVDLHENLNARATALLLRDTPGIGEFLRIISWPVSKLFEYKVTGTLRDPRMTPLYDISKILLAPLHPLKTLENILPVGDTNAVITAPPPRK